MPLLSAEGISLQFRGRKLFENASFSVDRHDRVGIVGANGTGKSTLLRMLTGTIQPDGGRVSKARGVRIGYLPQEIAAVAEGTLLETVLDAAPRRADLEAQIAAVEAELAASNDPDEQLSLSESLSELHTERAMVEKNYAKHRAEQILGGLGFAQDDLHRSVKNLSGGWRMRGALAAILFQNPDVLLLDEPTNHLDMPTVHWLNGFMRGFRHALVLICHDREFLNRHIKRVVSLEVEGVRTYKGNYDDYLEQRELEIELLEARAANEEAKKKDLQAFVDRFRAKASKARQAQSKMKMIEKMEERMVEVPQVRRSVSLKFAPVSRCGDTVVSAEHISHAYGERMIFDDLSLTVRRGDRIAIVGLNGAGKTTLLRLIAGELEPKSGSITLGHKVELRYFAQHHAESLRLDRTVIDEVWSAAPELSNTEARTMCGAFLFSGDDVEKPVAVLSGGEKARVALAKLLIKPGNFLLLDEPTNHLDTESAEKLTASLESYDGTLLFVSHNLDFARRLSNKVWDVHDRRVEIFPGSLGDYLDKLGDAAEHLNATIEREEKKAPEVEDRAAKKQERQRAREAEAERRKKRSQLEKKIASAEAEIARLEAEQKDVEAALSDPANAADGEKARSLALKYDSVRKSLETTLGQWEDLSEKLAAFDAEN